MSQPSPVLSPGDITFGTGAARGGEAVVGSASIALEMLKALESSCPWTLHTHMTVLIIHMFFPSWKWEEEVGTSKEKLNPESYSEKINFIGNVEAK